MISGPKKEVELISSAAEPKSDGPVVVGSLAGAVRFEVAFSWRVTFSGSLAGREDSVLPIEGGAIGVGVCGALLVPHLGQKSACLGGVKPQLLQDKIEFSEFLFMWFPKASPFTKSSEQAVLLKCFFLHQEASVVEALKQVSVPVDIRQLPSEEILACSYFTQVEETVNFVGV